MKYVIISLFVGIAFLSGQIFAKDEVVQSSTSSSQLLQPVDHNAVANWIKIRTAKDLALRYHLASLTDEEYNNAAIRNLYLKFQNDQLIPIEQARSLIVNCAETVAANINANRAIRPYLKEYPFSAARVQVLMYPSLEDEEKLKKPGYPIVLTLYQGVVNYCVFSPDSNSSKRAADKNCKNITESYEKAREIVSKEGKLETSSLLQKGKEQSTDTPEQNELITYIIPEPPHDYIGSLETKIMHKWLDAYSFKVAEQEKLVSHETAILSIEDNCFCPYLLSFHGFHKFNLEQARVFAANIFGTFFDKLKTNTGVKAYNDFLVESFSGRKDVPTVGPEVMISQAGLQVTFWDENMDRIQKPCVAQILIHDGICSYYEADPQTQKLQLIFKEPVKKVMAFRDSQANQKAKN
ncbi:MAG: hypothetical protein JWO53_855 [Chlamydiia bacterium]|nr:hypothetical protein [Chlamydiia bacterium]